jgi:hypothetical protein
MTHSLPTVILIFADPNLPSDEHPPELYSAASQRFDK